MRLPSLLAAALLALGLLAAPAHGGLVDEPGVTPVAQPGTDAAAKRALSASELRQELAGAMRSAGGRSGAWVADLEAGAGRVLFTDDAHERRIPASNQKLFTTAAFLERFGAGGNLETRVYAEEPDAAAGDGTIDGDLVIVGDGDPALATARFARRHDQPVTKVSALAGKIERSGVRSIAGRVLADDTVFDRKRRAGPYLSPLSGLSFNNGYAGGGRYARAPELVAAKELKAALRKRGVKVAGRVGHAELPDRAREREPLAAVASPPVEALIEETNVPSNNFFAEMLLKRLGAEDGGIGTRRSGAREVEQVTAQLGSDVQAADGSGLSRRNAASPAEVGELLAAMAQDPDTKAAFRDSLPVAGREGTVADRMRGTAAEGSCATKTGTLDGVSALSGYCEAGKRTLAFSVLMNSVDVYAARSAQDRFAAAVARYRP